MGVEPPPTRGSRHLCPYASPSKPTCRRTIRRTPWVPLPGAHLVDLVSLIPNFCEVRSSHKPRTLQASWRASATSRLLKNVDAHGGG